MEQNVYLVLFVTVAGLIITYHLIRTAVESGTSRIYKELRMRNRLLMEKLRKEGYAEADFEQLYEEMDFPYWRRMKAAEKSVTESSKSQA